MGLKERRQRERDEVRAKILDAARDLFAAEGVEAVSMRKIADAVEYSPTIIYQYFADKDTLLHEICTEDFGALARTFVEIANVADPIKRIEQIGLAYGRFGIEHPNHYRLMFMTPFHGKRLNAEELCKKGNPDEDGYAFLKQTVTEAIAAGRFRIGLTDADMISQVLWAMVHGIVSLHITKANDPWLEWRPFERRIQLMIDAVIRGLTEGSEARRQ
ncbi:MAG: TetR/AcrR family transcriptional regulator [Tepidisphaeraceae bacterium]|jgi:AcrR family transcriptional regulator